MCDSRSKTKRSGKVFVPSATSRVRVIAMPSIMVLLLRRKDRNTSRNPLPRNGLTSHRKGSSLSATWREGAQTSFPAYFMPTWRDVGLLGSTQSYHHLQALEKQEKAAQAEDRHQRPTWYWMDILTLAPCQRSLLVGQVHSLWIGGRRLKHMNHSLLHCV